MGIADGPPVGGPPGCQAYELGKEGFDYSEDEVVIYIDKQKK